MSLVFFESGQRGHQDDGTGDGGSIMPRLTRTSFMSSLDIRRPTIGGFSILRLWCTLSSWSTNNLNEKDEKDEAKDCRCEIMSGGGRCAGVGEVCNNVRCIGDASGEGEFSLK